MAPGRGSESGYFALGLNYRPPSPNGPKFGRTVSRTLTRTVSKQRLVLMVVVLVILLALIYGFYWTSTSSALNEWTNREQHTGVIRVGNGIKSDGQQGLQGGEEAAMASDATGNGRASQDGTLRLSKAVATDVSKKKWEDEGGTSPDTQHITPAELHQVEPMGKEVLTGKAVSEAGEPGPAASKCPEGCLDHGTCNEETGRCHCLASTAGPTCSEPAMPACHLAPGYAPACILPTSCACAMDCDRYRMPHHGVCFVEQRPDGSIEKNLASLYAGPQAELATDLRGHERGQRRRVEEGEEVSHGKRFTDPSACPMKCSGRGICLADTKQCRCPWGYAGAGCDEYGPTPFRCMNKCSGRGECVGYGCKCERGYFGMDCSLFIGPEGTTQIVSRPPYFWTDAVPAPSPNLSMRPRVYVYDLPGEFNTWQYEHSDKLDGTEELLFMERMLNSAYRTADPGEADFFYVPLILRNRNEMKASLVDWALEFISTHWPFYNRSNGADHIFLTTGEWGNCGVAAWGGAYAPLARSITLSLWSLTTNMLLQSDNPEMLPCFRQGTDVAMPPRMDDSVLDFVPFLRDPKTPKPERTILLYLNGCPGKDAKAFGPYTWSFGVCQKMFELYEGKEEETGIRLVAADGLVSGHLEEMERSIFCLAPSGWGWGMRATQAAMLGCIPVVIQPNVTMPLEGDLLHWSAFSVRLGLEDIPRIAAILRSLSPEEVEEKRRGLEGVWRRFVWTSPQYNPLRRLPPATQAKLAPLLAEQDVFASLMAALARRVEKKVVSAEEAGKSRAEGAPRPAGPAANGVPGPSRCPGGCSAHGTCNEELRQCQCLGGHAGPTCADHAMPSCHLAQGYYTPCHLPTSCACVAECDAQQFAHEKLCFDERREDGRTETDVGRLFEGPQVHLRMDGDGRETGPRDPLPEGQGFRRRFTGPERCPLHCSGRGVCQLDPGRNITFCGCAWAYRGEGCELPGDVPFPCLNACSGRGECVDGTCRCEGGSFGMDCSLSLDREGRPRALQRSPFLWWPAGEWVAGARPKIYVYELPGSFHSWQFQQAKRLDYPEQALFLERLLASPYRTADADKADFFYLPLILRNRGPLKRRLLVRAIEYVKATWPGRWERYGGGDHLVFTSGDWGNCEFDSSREGDPIFDSMITISLWGMTRNMKLTAERPCFRYGKDIVSPPHLTPRVYEHSPFLQDPPAAKPNRTILLYFKGHSRTEQTEDGNKSYSFSFGVVQKMFELYEGKERETGILLERSQGHPGGFLENMARSVFCLAPAGYGWGMRATQAAMLGCIPVVIQPDVLQPFEGDLLDWSEFAVRLQPEDIPHLEAILRSIPQEEIAQGRAALEEVWPRFVWSSPHLSPLAQRPDQPVARWARVFAEKDAFATIVEVLALRLGNRTAGGSWTEEPRALPAGVASGGAGGRAGVAGAGGGGEGKGAVEAAAAEEEEEELAWRGPSRCPPECSQRGTCNEELGRCECLINYAGPTCQAWAMPACHLAPESPAYFTPCNMPSSCACVAECAAYRFSAAESYTPVHDPLCFDEQRGDGRTETDPVQLYAGPQARVLLDDSWREVERERLGSPAEGFEDEWVGPELCPNMCSQRGVCQKLGDEYSCLCPWIYGGEDCSGEGVVPFRCFNGCSGKGVCVDGACHCRRGFFGLDCSLSLDAHGKPKLLSRSPLPWAPTVPPPPAGVVFRPRIYVYEIPQHLNTWQFQHALWLDWPEQVLFLERLLASGHRTADPEEADFFFIPLMFRNRNSMKLPAFEAALDFIQETWPKFWDRHKGRDHFVLVNDDWGTCEYEVYGQGASRLDEVMVVTLWGHTRNSSLGDEKPCFRPGKDIVMPPVMTPDVYAHVPFLKASLDEIPEKTIFAYFRGFSGRGSHAFGPFEWSFGVRQKLFELFEGREKETGILLEGTTQFVPVYGFLESMERSIFCLAPAGWGWAMRSTQAVILGCIPVVIQPEVVQPLEGDLLDWEDFAVMLTFDDIPRLSEILRSIPGNVLEEKRAAGRRLWPRFVWASPSVNPLANHSHAVVAQWGPLLAEGDVFSSLMAVLAQRWERKGQPGSWLGGAPLEGLDPVPYFGKLTKEERRAAARGDRAALPESPRPEASDPGGGTAAANEASGGSSDGSPGEGERGTRGGSARMALEASGGGTPEEGGEEGSSDATTGAKRLEVSGGGSPWEAATGGSSGDVAPSASSKVEEDGDLSGGTGQGSSGAEGARRPAGPAANGVAGPSRCPGGCSAHGTCNEELRQCQCLGGHAGPTCADHAMPSCHLAQGYYTPCLFMSTCGCKAECDAYRFTTPPLCFDERRDDGTNETDLGKLVAGPQAFLQLDWKGREMGRWPVPAANRNAELASPEECPNRCSGRGVCRADSKLCMCAWMHGGPDCSELGDVPVVCFNRCSGHGECRDGTCKCEPGYFGIDCSLSIGPDGRTQMLRRPPFQWSDAVPAPPPDARPRPRVYVYELPGYYNTWQFQHSHFLDWPEPVFFLERLLASPHRTANGDEADFFYIPLILRTRVYKKKETLAWAIEHVNATWPYWNRNNGRDHMVITNDDWGNCEIGTSGEGEPLLDDMVAITLWGHTKNMALEETSPCFRPGRHIVMPPQMIPEVYNHVPSLKETLREFLKGSKQPYEENLYGPKLEQLERTTFAYFKGWPAFTSGQHGDYTWSFGVRQHLFNLYADRENETGIRLVATDGPVLGHLEEMERSIFCLAPSGWGWGMRATQAAMLGCIPVVIQPGVVQALEGDLLDWNNFGIHLTMNDIPSLAETLREIPPEVIEKKRRACAEVWTRFVWASTHLNPLERYPKEVQDRWAPILAEKDAFASIMAALAHRLHNRTTINKNT